MSLIAAWNGLKILSTDVGNAYLNAECREKVHVKYGKELFGPEHEGKYTVIVRALYGLKSSGASWRHHFTAEIRNMGFKDTKADGDVYRKKSYRDNKMAYYEYMFVYIDDVICISEAPKHWINILSKQDRLREIGVPKRFLGSDIKSKQYNGHNNSCWAF